MAGAEGERGLDLDADAVDRNAVAIVRAMHDEAPGGDRLEPGEAFAAPNRVGATARSAAPWRAAAPGGGGGQRAHRILVGRGAKMDRHAP